MASKASSVTWTGKNLAEVRKFHKDVAHYPEDPKAPHVRDASQHPDNLHVEADGRTLVLGIGDTLTRDANGTLGVGRGGVAPRTLAAVPPSKGRTFNATGGGR